MKSAQQIVFIATEVKTCDSASISKFELVGRNLIRVQRLAGVFSGNQLAKVSESSQHSDRLLKKHFVHELSLEKN